MHLHYCKYYECTALSISAVYCKLKNEWLILHWIQVYDIRTPGRVGGPVNRENMFYHFHPTACHRVSQWDQWSCYQLHHNLGKLHLDSILDTFNWDENSRKTFTNKFCRNISLKSYSSHVIYTKINSQCLQIWGEKIHWFAFEFCNPNVILKLWLNQSLT